MPRTEHNIGRQRSTKHQVTIDRLLTMRGHQLRHSRLGTDTEAQANIDAIDHVLVNVIGYKGNIAEESRDFRRVALFKRGELRRAVADTMRRAERPPTALEVAQAALAPKGVHVSYARKHKNRISSIQKVLLYPPF